LAPGSPQEKLSAIPNLGNKPTKVNWTLSWSHGLIICSGVVLQKGFNKRLDPLGKADKHYQTFVFQKARRYPQQQRARTGVDTAASEQPDQAAA